MPVGSLPQALAVQALPPLVKPPATPVDRNKRVYCKVVFQVGMVRDAVLSPPTRQPSPIASLRNAENPSLAILAGAARDPSGYRSVSDPLPMADRCSPCATGSGLGVLPVPGHTTVVVRD